MKVIICDGASLGNPGESSIGVVVWDRLGGKNKSRRISPSTKIGEKIGWGTNNEAEWRAVLRALIWVIETGATDDIYMYSDSQVIVNQALGNWKARDSRMAVFKGEYDNSVRQIKKRNPSQVVCLSWLPRQLTVLADKEAAKA